MDQRFLAKTRQATELKLICSPWIVQTFQLENFCRKFRTRETRDAGVDLENLAIVGEQVGFLRNTRNSFLFRRTGRCTTPPSPTSVWPRGPAVPLYPGQRLSASPTLRLPCKRSTTPPSFSSCILTKIGGRVRGRGELQGAVWQAWAP